MTVAPALDLACVLRIHPHARFRLFGEEAVIVVQGSAEVLGVNEVGARLLALLDGRRTLAAVLGALRAEFDVEPGRLQGDVLAFARELVAAGVLATNGDPEAR